MYGDNSFLILLFGLLTIILIGVIILIWYLNIQENRNEEILLKSGKNLPSNRKVLGSLLGHQF